MSALASQFSTEVRLTLRRGESLLLILGLPLFFLVFFSSVDVLPTGPGRSIDFLTPGILALAVMSTSMVSLAIATGFERSYGVLKRLGATPLGRPRIVIAKTGGVVAVELVQFAIIVPVAFAFGWELKAEVNLAAANGLYLVLLLVSGMMFSLDELPGPARSAARLLPSGALADVLRGTLSAASTPGQAWIVLAVWALATPALASRWFRWE